MARYLITLVDKKGVRKKNFMGIRLHFFKGVQQGKYPFFS